MIRRFPRSVRVLALLSSHTANTGQVVLDTLAEMIAYDRTSDGGSSASSSAGVE